MLYRQAADAAVAMPSATDAERTILRAGLQEAGNGSGQHVSWALRRAFDDVFKLATPVDLMSERAQMLAEERERATQPMQEEIRRLHAQDLQRQDEQYRRWAAIPEAPLQMNSLHFPFQPTRSLAPQPWSEPQPWSGPLRPEQRPWPGEPRPLPQQQPSAPAPRPQPHQEPSAPAPRPIQPSWLANQPRPPGSTRYPVKKDVTCCCFSTPMKSIPPNRLPRLRAGMSVCLMANYQSIGNARNGPLQPGEVGRLVQDYLTTVPGYQGRDCYLVDFNGWRHWYDEETLRVAPAVLPAPAPVTRPTTGRLKVGMKVRLTANCLSVSAGAGDIKKGPLRPGDVGTLLQDYLLVDPSYKGKDCYQVEFQGSKHWYDEGTLEQSRLKVGTRVRLSSSPQRAPASPGLGTMHVRVFRIMNFKDTAGFMDKTDPYVKLQYGTSMQKTATKNNAGGNAVFNQVFSFDKNPSLFTELKVAVHDSDTVSDDLLGQTTIGLRGPDDCNSEEELRRMQDGRSYDVFDATGRVAGQVVLAFASSVRGDIRKGPLRPGDVGVLVEDYLLVDPSYKGKDCYQVLFKGSKDWYEDWEIEEVTTLTSQWEEIGPIQWEGGIAMKGDRPIYQENIQVPDFADNALLPPGLCFNVCLVYVLLSLFRLFFFVLPVRSVLSLCCVCALGMLSVCVFAKP